MEDSQSFAPAPRKTLTPMDIQQKEFRVSRLGGYKMRDVDEFLDEITDSFSALIAEIERLRSGPASAAVVGTPDLADVGRQADEIIARARAEAARIVADAHAETAAAGSPAGSGASRGGPGVADFLVEEREFLQNLAGLVQGHAEIVKGLARAAHGRASAQAPGTTAEPEDLAESRETAAAEDPAPSVSAPPPAAPPPTAPMPKADAPVRIEDPEPASVARADRDDETPSEDGGGTLRDLFWGED